MDAGPHRHPPDPEIVPTIGLREVLDSAPDLIFVCDVAGTLLWVNTAVEELTGRSRAELVGQRFTVIIPTDEHKRILRQVRDARVGGASVISIETPIDVQGGSLAVIEARVRVVGTGAGAGLFIGVGRPSVGDATAEGELEQRLAQVTQALEQARAVAQLKADALATMTHEIRSPMNGILGLLHILLEGELDRDQRGIVEILQNSSRTLLSLMNDTLEFSRLESGKVELHRVDFDVVNTVHDIASLLGPIANEKGLGFDCRVAPDVPRLLHGDPGRLRQVIVNLTTNAIKFTDQGSVTMKIELTGRNGDLHDLRFSISDTGIGIAAADVARLFQPYEQANAAIAQRFGGTGLGLSISRKLMQMMGGEMGVESTIGQGSTFWLKLELPVATGAGQDTAAPLSSTPHGAVMMAGLANEIATARRPAPTSEGHAAAPTAEGAKRVLLVEDSPVNQMVILWSLQKHGCRVDTAANGGDALTAFGREGYDVVLLDLNLPDWRGQDVAREMRKLEMESGRRAVIAAMTGSEADEALESCLAAGMDEFLTKPIDLEVLAGRVHAWTADGGAPAEPQAASPTPDAGHAPRAGAPIALSPSNVVPFRTAEEREADVETLGRPAIDLDRLDTMSMGSAALRATLLSAFLSEIEPRMARIEAAHAAGDAKALEFEAHGLKGMTGTIGAVGAQRIFDSIEHQAREGDLAPLGPLVRQARLETARVTDFIASLPTAEAA